MASRRCGTRGGGCGMTAMVCPTMQLATANREPLVPNHEVSQPSDSRAAGAPIAAFRCFQPVGQSRFEDARKSLDDRSSCPSQSSASCDKLMSLRSSVSSAFSLRFEHRALCVRAHPDSGRFIVFSSSSRAVSGRFEVPTRLHKNPNDVGRSLE